MSARLPVCVVTKIWYGGESEIMVSVSISSAIAAAALSSEDVGVRGMMVRDEMKCPWWKMLRCKSRWPERDFGSSKVVNMNNRQTVPWRRTLWVELKYVNVALRVCNYNIKLLSIRQKVGYHDFEVLYILAKQSHLVRLLLHYQVVSTSVTDWFSRRCGHTEYPVNQTPLTASPITHKPVPFSSRATLT